jgi:hypothetical protein
MANEIGPVPGVSAATHYFQLFRLTDNAVWKTTASAFEAFEPANWADYDVPLVEETGTGLFFGDLPAVPVGGYQVVAYERAGGAPAITDNKVFLGGLDWSGAALVSIAGVNAKTTNLPSDPADASDIAAAFAAVPAAVWANGTRSLTSFGTLVADIWSAVTDSPGVTTLLARIPAALFSGITSLAQWLGLLAGKQVGNTTARTELRATGAGAGTFDETTDSLEAIADDAGGAGTIYGEDGAIEFTYTVYKPGGVIPLPGVAVFVSADVNGTQRSQTKTTDALGRVQFLLDAGTYYFWRTHPGYTFTDPDAEVVS